jgi:hypothetical protein
MMLLVILSLACDEVMPNTEKTSPVIFAVVNENKV